MTRLTATGKAQAAPAARRGPGRPRRALVLNLVAVVAGLTCPRSSRA